MRKHLLKLTSLLSVALAVALFVPQRAAADEDDPPSRVARLSYAHGTVSFNPAGTDDWVSAVVNRPITTGDKLWTDNGSRAELHIGSAAIRLSSNTGFSFLNLDDRTAQIRVTEGTLNVRVRRLEEDETFEIDTPNLAFSVLRPGNYKIDVNEAGDTTVVTVRDGEGEVTGGGSAYTIHARETGTFAGIDQLDADVQRFSPDEDDFDHWCYDRDRHADHSTSARYVSTDVIGYDDLDDYGGWRDAPEYGHVWFPHTTVVGWAPYRYGHWVWISPWGWTWVDDEPWGFAPFHYGRWVAVGGVWGWVPCAPRAVVGIAYVRPVYAPALVAWVGGPHFAMGVAVGGGAAVGWFPLGPREVYVPSYHVSRTYVNNVNISNTTVNTTVVNNYYNTNVVNNNTTVTNVRYVNQGVPGAVTATSAQVLTTSQPVARNVVRADERQMASAQVAVRAPAMAPERQAFVGAGQPASARPPERIENRAVVARTAPPPPPPSVERQQVAIRQNGGQRFAVSQARQIEPQQRTVAAPVRIAPPARPAQHQNDAGNRPGQPQNNVRPGREGDNAPQNAPQNNRPNTLPSNAERPGNVQPNRPAVNNQPAAPAANNDRPNNQRNDRPASARPDNNRPDTQASQPQNNAGNRPGQPQNNVRPGREGDNAPQNAPPNNRPNTPPPNAERPGNVQPNRPAVNSQPAAPAANNDRPNNQRNDRPASARPDNNRPDTQPANAQPNRAPASDRSNTPAPNAQPNRPLANDRPANEQQGRQQPPARQQPQEVQQQQQRPPQAERQQPPARQQPQEVQQQQQRPPQAERQQPPARQQPQEVQQQQQRPPQAERQQQQQPKQQD